MITLLLACAQATSLLSSSPVLPQPATSPDTLLLREWIPLGPGERSLGRVERFATDGCWSVSSNLMLWVHDPLLVVSTERALFLNGADEPEPWFCLDASQRWRLERALTLLPRGDGVDLPADARLAVRWTAWVGGERRSLTVAYGVRDRRLAPVEDLLGSLVAEGAWGQSPE